MADAYLWIEGSDKSVLGTPDMDSYVVEYLPIASSRRTIAGTLKTDWSALKHRWSFTMSGMVSLDLIQYKSVSEEFNNVLWQAPDSAAATFRVRIMESRWRQQSPGRYAAEMVLEEA
jgi:hypothetical protein